MLFDNNRRVCKRADFAVAPVNSCTLEYSRRVKTASINKKERERELKGKKWLNVHLIRFGRAVTVKSSIYGQFDFLRLVLVGIWALVWLCNYRVLEWNIVYKFSTVSIVQTLFFFYWVKAVCFTRVFFLPFFSYILQSRVGTCACV